MTDATSGVDLPEDLDSNEPATKRDVGLIYRDLITLRDGVKRIDTRLAQTATTDDVEALGEKVESAVDVLKATSDKLQNHFDTVIDNVVGKLTEAVRKELRDAKAGHDARIAKLEHHVGLR